MAKRSVNLFPENLRKSITEVFTGHVPHLVLIQISPPTTDADGSFYNPPPERLLHPKELAILAGYKLSKRRSEFLAGRYCVKIAITNYLHNSCPERPGVSMDTIEICAGPGGRPAALLHSLPTQPAVDVSIAHSREYAAAIAMDAVCGIDLQQSSATLSRVQSRYCTPEELRLLKGALPQAAKLERLTLLWTAKEAAKKALSYWRMPGFLDLEVVDYEGGLQNCSCLTLAVKKSGSPGLPAEITVVASTFASYGLAVCIIYKDKINA